MASSAVVPGAGEAFSLWKAYNRILCSQAPFLPAIDSIFYVASQAVPEVQGKFFLLPELPLALQEVAVKIRNIRACGGRGRSSPTLQFLDTPTPPWVPYLRRITNPANISEDGVRTHRHVLQDHLKPQSHHGCQPAHQGWVHPSRHAALRARKQIDHVTRNLLHLG